MRLAGRMAARAWRIGGGKLRCLLAIVTAKLALLLGKHALAAGMGAVVTGFRHGVSPELTVLQPWHGPNAGSVQVGSTLRVRLLCWDFIPAHVGRYLTAHPVSYLHRMTSLLHQ